MILSMDEDLQRVAEYMQKNIPAEKLVSVAAGLSKVATMLWGHFTPQAVQSLTLVAEPISGDDQRTQPTSSECGLVTVSADDGSAVGMDRPH